MYLYVLFVLPVALSITIYLYTQHSPNVSSMLEGKNSATECLTICHFGRVVVILLIAQIEELDN